MPFICLYRSHLLSHEAGMSMQVIAEYQAQLSERSTISYNLCRHSEWVELRFTGMRGVADPRYMPLPHVYYHVTFGSSAI